MGLGSKIHNNLRFQDTHTKKKKTYFKKWGDDLNRHFLAHTNGHRPVKGWSVS